jgi:hypothetical protein
LSGEVYAKFVPRLIVESKEYDEMVGLTCSSDGQRVSCATRFHTWRWDIATGSLAVKLSTDEMGKLLKPDTCKFSLDGESIAFESFSLIRWISTGKSSGGRITRLQVCDNPGLWAWTLSLDGKVVVTATSAETREKILTFWDAVSGKLLYSTNTTCESFIRGNWYLPFENIKGLCFSNDSS